MMIENTWTSIKGKDSELFILIHDNTRHMVPLSVNHPTKQQNENIL